MDDQGKSLSVVDTSLSFMKSIMYLYCSFYQSNSYSFELNDKILVRGWYETVQ